MLKKRVQFLKRKQRVGRKIRTAAMNNGALRVAFCRTNRHIHVQIVDDKIGQTMFSSSTLSAQSDVGANKNLANKKGATLVGQSLAKQIVAAGKEKNLFVFDRGGYAYAGIANALVESMKEMGVSFSKS